MSYQEKSITVALFSYLLILGYFLIHWIPMYQQNNLKLVPVFSLWGTVIVTSILANIICNILANIVLSIVHAIRTRSEEIEAFIADERDRLIELKGMRVSYIAFSIGVLLATLTFAFGQPPLIMVSVIIFSSTLAEIFGSLAQIYHYRRGA